MIRDLVAHHVVITSTLSVFETFVPNPAALDARVLDAMLPDTRIEYLERRSSTSDHAATSVWPALFKKELEFEHEFDKRGGLLLAGLDPTGYSGAIAGFGDQREVELLVEAGFTPLEAIPIATSNGAEFLGELDKIGTLAPGKAADIVVLQGEPRPISKTSKRLRSSSRTASATTPRSSSNPCAASAAFTEPPCARYFGGFNETCVWRCSCAVEQVAEGVVVASVSDVTSCVSSAHARSRGHRRHSS
jgi:hypothetical protein